MKLITLSSEGTMTLALMLIKNAEGFSNVPYKDSLGNWTIGYGFNMSLPEFSDIKHIDEIEADSILRVRIMEISSGIINNISITEYGYGGKINTAILIDMAYNLGIEGLSLFNTFLSYLRLGKNAQAVADLTNTLWYSQVKERAVRNCLNILLNNPNYLYLM